MPTLEFDMLDSVTRKILGLWGLPQFQQSNLRLRIEGDEVVFTMLGRPLTQIPMTLFDKLAVYEIADIITKSMREPMT